MSDDTTVPASFFEPEGRSDRGLAFRATSHTRGPWSPDAQHGGPPAALIGHVLEVEHPREGFAFARLTFEILRPVPVARLHVRSEVTRGGRSVELLTADLVDDDGTAIMSASAWRIRTGDIPLGVGVGDDRVPGPEDGAEPAAFFRFVGHTGYAQAMEVRFIEGGWEQPGPAIAWMRMRHPLVPEVAPSPLVRVLCAADSGNGVSASFDGVFINPELTVHLHRMPVDEWVCLQAATTLTDHGIGLASSILHDVAGPIGRGAQALLLDTAPTG